MTITTRADKGTELTHAELDENFTDLRDNPDGTVFPKEQNIGIKIDPALPDFGWHDIIGNIHIHQGEPNAGSSVIYRGGLRQMQLAENQEGFINLHLPHDYVIGSPIFVHVHWSHNSPLVTGGSVTWVFETSYAKGHNQSAFSPPVPISIVQNVSVNQYQHMIGETAASTAGGSSTQLNTSDLEVDGIMMCRLYLDSNDIITSDASIVNPFVHFVDIHYQSTGIATKNRAPNFWT